MVGRGPVGLMRQRRARQGAGASSLEPGILDARGQDAVGERRQRGRGPRATAAALGPHARPLVPGVGRAAAATPPPAVRSRVVPGDRQRGREDGHEGGQERESHRRSRRAQPRPHAVVSAGADASAEPPLSSKCHFQIS
jgi:hypothetical protein